MPADITFSLADHEIMALASTGKVPDVLKEKLKSTAFAVLAGEDEAEPERTTVRFTATLETDIPTEALEEFQGRQVAGTFQAKTKWDLMLQTVEDQGINPTMKLVINND